MAIRTELSLRLQNSPGALARVCQHLWGERVNILAFCIEGGGTLRLVVDNPLHASGLLQDNDYTVEQRDVLVVHLPSDAGALENAARLLSNAGISIDYAYGSAVEDQGMAAIVFGVEDAQRAATASGL